MFSARNNPTGFRTLVEHLELQLYSRVWNYILLYRSFKKSAGGMFFLKIIKTGGNLINKKSQKRTSGREKHSKQNKISSSFIGNSRVRRGCPTNFIINVPKVFLVFVGEKKKVFLTFPADF